MIHLFRHFVLAVAVSIVTASTIFSQNPLFIPQTLSGTNFILNVQSGTQNFYDTIQTPTYGINGPFLGPTLIVNKWDSVTLNVNNGLNVPTTMHWHGLHVAPENDGGPHQVINPGETWSPSFRILNNASTFWYHPHGAGQTDPQVSKGLAGLFIVKDSAEAALDLPRTYGVDDFPLILQSKDFDVLQQIAIATETDTALFVNGTLNAELTVPEQVVRFRVLNGSSLRSYNLGFSNNQPFYKIGTDGGLVDTPLVLTRLRISPGERYEILVNYSGMNGQSMQLMSYASELPDGIYGAASVGTGNDTIHDYSLNFLNGVDFPLLEIVVDTQTAGAVTSIPNSLVPYQPFNAVSATLTRGILLDTLRLLSFETPNLAEGPFGINGNTFNMDSINTVCYLNDIEIWNLINNTHVAHPFHIHDIQFNIIERSGMPPADLDRGWKDVVLVMPHDSVKFITKFATFANPSVPYMYHCHMLHHEDDGMMGSFLVIDSTAIGLNEPAGTLIQFSVFPNPASGIFALNICNPVPDQEMEVIVRDLSGRQIYTRNVSANEHKIHMDSSGWPDGLYFIYLVSGEKTTTRKLIVINH